MGRSYEVRKASMAKTAGAKTKVYSKYSKEIYVVGKNGGADLDANVQLRSLVERAKKDQVPSHVIEKALEKARGGAGEDYEAARYEGYAAGGSMVIVDCLTDNNKRTYAEVRQCFVKTDAKLGSPGCAAHMFEHQAIFAFAGDDEDAVLEVLMMADVDVTDVEVEDGVVTVFAPHTEYGNVRKALSEAYPDLNLDVEQITFVPQTFVTLEGEDLETFDKFLGMLEDCDDVQNVYHNVEA
ncbi:YebC/PmpR family DNA-binding transcriptional regulator [Alginatibacterium sediminis]|uniref:Probable transcriptional regulatory protein DBZ36_19510 n=1 Tax=Alginatibacterium sediminis TaxID=2164068 RepID=A0A420E6F4_9ALTE|nr:YebC/PmpR family DNA-binding transcriptional regulator [Alginatibacterium sediminis]RKF13247.1 YebC/PmpR family DNA-binding transcriptional regulator [Alginatibacterium sediminis]